MEISLKSYFSGGQQEGDTSCCFNDDGLWCFVKIWSTFHYHSGAHYRRHLLCPIRHDCCHRVGQFAIYRPQFVQESTHSWLLNILLFSK